MSVVKQVFRRRDDVRWDPVFALRPELDRVEVETWSEAGVVSSDLTVFYTGSREPFPFSSLLEGEFKEWLADAWAEVVPEAFVGV